MSLYLILDLGSLIIPLIFSFHPKLRFDQKLRYVVPGLLVSMAIFVAWDVWFTDMGVWGFNEDYLVGLHLFGLPLEEWLFFICIPYASIFTHHCLVKLLPSWRPSLNASNVMGLVLLGILISLSLGNLEKWYTSLNFAFTALILIVALTSFKEVLRSYWFPYLVILIPFLIVNGVLTGSFIENEVVWYNNAENIGIRAGTIPVEDFMYGFTMILIPILIAHKLEENHKKRQKLS
jgi:lycopene cyclase domain-containing protein